MFWGSTGSLVNQHVSVPSIMAFIFDTRVAKAVSRDALVAEVVSPGEVWAVRDIVGTAASAKMALTYQNSFVLEILWGIIFLTS